MTLRSFAIGAAVALVWIGAAAAQSVAPSPSTLNAATSLPAPADAQEVITRMLARNAGLETYTVRVHVHLHTAIPFYSPTLEGTAYYKRPGSFAVVFDRVPSYMKSVQQLFTDVGDPTGWEKDSNIKLRGTEELDGKPMLVLVLTKKIYSDQIKDTIAYVDPTNYELPEMDFHYTNGQSIVMKQTYRNENGYDVVVEQHVDGNRRIRATGEAQYETYQTNVAVNDAVFNPQQQQQ
jgi:outer membrane lipoprotein-sorting protein